MLFVLSGGNFGFLWKFLELGFVVVIENDRFFVEGVFVYVEGCEEIVYNVFVFFDLCIFVLIMSV